MARNAMSPPDRDDGSAPPVNRPTYADVIANLRGCAEVDANAGFDLNAYVETQAADMLESLASGEALRAAIADLGAAIGRLDKALQRGSQLAYTAPEASALVGLSESGIRRLVRDGLLARVPHTDRLLIARIELERWVNSTSADVEGR